MNLVRVGAYTINLEQVNYAHYLETEGTLYLYFSGPFAANGIESLQCDYVKLTGRDADEFNEYLQASAEEMITYPPAPSLTTPEPKPERDDIPF